MKVGEIYLGKLLQFNILLHKYLVIDNDCNKVEFEPLPDSCDHIAKGPNLKFQPSRRFESDRTHIDFSAGRRILLRGTKTISRRSYLEDSNIQELKFSYKWGLA